MNPSFAERIAGEHAPGMSILVSPTSHTRFARVRARLEAYAPPPGWPSWLYEFALFGFKQGWACLIGALLLTLLCGTYFFYAE
jgi:hypothetical protein